MKNGSSTNLVQKTIEKIKNHPILARIIIAGIIIISIGSVAGAIKNIRDLIPHSKAPAPRIYDFSTCLEPCNGTNAITEFPDGTTKIYLSWKFENIPIGAHYVKIWTWEGNEWVKYDCTWRGPESGEDTIPPMTEMGGFRSGRWVMTIYINDVIVFHSPPITIQGNNQYWKPVEGTIYNCYGKVP